MGMSGGNFYNTVKTVAKFGVCGSALASIGMFAKSGQLTPALLAGSVFTGLFVGAGIGYQYAIAKQEEKPLTVAGMDYSAWKKALKDRRLPAAFVDMDAFDRNIEKLADLAKKNNKKVRIATKSIRIPELILRVLANNPEVFQGVMCFTVEEAKFLHGLGVKDLLIAYPTVQPSDLRLLREMHDSSAKVSLVIDSEAHMQALDNAMKGIKKPLPVIIDIDMSPRAFNGKIHLGVRRSPVRTIEDLQQLLKTAHGYPSINPIGAMGYEATVAGLTDNNPYTTFLNPLAKLVRKWGISHAANIREQVPEVFKAAGFTLEIFNGGGTGSVNYSVKQKALTEITVGSGLLCSHLFDYYSNLKDDFYFLPAAYFALQVDRSSDPGYVTCLGGGYVASGPPGWDRYFIPILPQGLKLTTDEAGGEVHTPLKVEGLITPKTGEPVLCRSAKSGEIYERFNEVHLVTHGEIKETVETYRGKGKCFL